MTTEIKNYFDDPGILSDYYRENKDAFMDELLLPDTDPGRVHRAKFGYIVHKFLGNCHDPFERPQDHILCKSQITENLGMNSIARVVDVTLVNSDVSCKDCLEWIHA